MVRIRYTTLIFALLASTSLAYADDVVSVRASAKDDYTRIVFEWPKPPSYVTDKTSSELTLKFQSAASFKIEGASPAGLPRVTAYSTPDGKTAVIGFTTGQEVRHFEIGNRVIVDIRGPINSKANAAAIKKPEPEPEQVAENASVAEIKPITKLPAPKIVAAPAAKVEKIEPVSKPSFQIQITSTEKMGLAVFKRFGNLWIVVDVADYPLEPEITGNNKKLGTFERIPLKEATAFRLALPEDKDFHVEGSGLVWKITANSQAALAAATEFQKVKEGDNAALLWPVATARRVVEIEDPSAGDVLKVATVEAARFYSGNVHRFAEFNSLESYAGLAVESKIDDLNVEKTKDGIRIDAPEGLSISPESDTAFLKTPETQAPAKPLQNNTPQQEKVEAPLKPGARIFRFGDWKIGDTDAIEQNRRLLLSGLAEKDEQAKAQDLLKLAKMELSHAHGQEASGYLDLAEQFVPDLKGTPEFLALKGAADAISGKYETALKDFSTENLKAFPETSLWKSYALAGLEDWKQAAETLPSNFDSLAGYPDEIRIPVALGLTEVALRDGNLPKAEELMKLAEGDKLILPYQSALNYMKGEALRQQGKGKEAEKLWEELSKGKDDLYRAKAGLALTSLQLENKELKPADGINRLEGLRYAWRGDELETSINYRLGKLYIANNDPLKGLALMRQASSLAPTPDQSQKIDAEMIATFNNLFEPNRIKDINPVDAISLYNEFSTLSPPGPVTDRIVRQLADRLVDADLLPRAANLLQTQIDAGKVSGIEGATTAIRLASIYVQDNKADKALAVLDKASAFLGKEDAPGLKRQIVLLKAEALSEQKKPEEAFAMLAGLEQDEEVLRLRADIGWTNQRWQDAADSLEALVQTSQISPTRPASDEEANLLLNWAVALYLADNRYVLANLREKFTTAMAATSKSSQFEVVTRPRQSALLADRDTIDAIIEETEIFKGFVENSRAAQNAQTNQAPARNVAPVTPAKPPVTVPSEN